MALLRCIQPLQFAPFHPLNCWKKRSVSFSPAVTSNKSTAIVWLKHDLRLDDHPGFVAASEYEALVPVYVFDHRIISDYPDEMLKLLLLSLRELRMALVEKGSNLMIQFGSSECVMRDLARQVLATNIFVEEEVAYGLSRLLNIVKQTLEEFPALERPGLTVWQTPFYEINNLERHPGSWEDFKKLNLQPTLPVSTPAIPGSDIELDWGPLPDFEDVKAYIRQNSNEAKNGWIRLKEKSAMTILREKFSKSTGKSKKCEHEGTQVNWLNKSKHVEHKGAFIYGGTDTVLDGLTWYLRCSKKSSLKDRHGIHEKVLVDTKRDTASFSRLFLPALVLGIISRRRVHHEAIKYEKESNAGLLSPFSYSAAAVAVAIDSVCSMEWYWLMAQKIGTSCEGRYATRIWRWRGHLIHYAVAGDQGPGVLLVHGFGAFFEHYRENIHNIAKNGNRVWAITLLGFGKSEKPYVVYTELLWAELLRDFIIEVVGEPVHLVGNSIGGFLVAHVAFFWPALAASVVLLNSAGQVIPGYSQLPKLKDRRASAAIRFGALLLLLYLRWNISGILKRLYPIHSQRAEGLVNEMLRASQDPGALAVLESIFSFDLSCPLNYLLEGCQDKVLIIQGTKDPLINSKSQLALWRELCPKIVIEELDAGHCPHDELPEAVNSILCRWFGAVHGHLPPAIAT